jgi:hypothetical protein
MGLRQYPQDGSEFIINQEEINCEAINLKLIIYNVGVIDVQGIMAISALAYR